MSSFLDRFGPWAVVTGAAQGIGAAFAWALAERGVSLVLIDLQAEALEQRAVSLRQRRVGVRTAVVDLREPDFVSALTPAFEGLDIGLLINNAGAAVTGPLLGNDPQAEADVLHLNCRAPLLLTRHLAPAMAARGSGGVVFVSSTIAVNGGPSLANYAATKAYDLALADALHVELKPAGIAVQAVLPGMTRTPALERSMDLDAVRIRPMDPRTVAEASLKGLGRHAVVVPGAVNKTSTFLSRRLLPRRVRHLLMANERMRPLKEADQEPEPR